MNYKRKTTNALSFTDGLLKLITGNPNDLFDIDIYFGNMTNQLTTIEIALSL
jgi:hypothetical protein